MSFEDYKKVEAVKGWVTCPVCTKKGRSGILDPWICEHHKRRGFQHGKNWCEFEIGVKGGSKTD